jgi:nucleotide-binding universal stress UspA family protein
MYKRILLPLDGSALAEQALPYAIAQAERFGAGLIVLRALQPLSQSGEFSTRAVKRAEERTKTLAREYLERVAAVSRAQGIPTEVVTVEGGPHEAIVKFAEDNAVDLIIISDHGRSGLTRWLVGTVADHVVRGAKVPVLLLRASQQPGLESDS